MRFEPEHLVSLGVVFHVDPEANAATIKFRALVPGQRRTYPIVDSAGSIIAAVSFDAGTGQLAQVELLDAVVQLPDSLR